MTTTSSDSQIVQWSEIDKVKFFGFGTVAYSLITFSLHPMTVLKTRQQVLNNTATIAKDSLLHQHTIRSTFSEIMASSGIRGLFRGAGIVVSLAIPARVLYIFTLETTRYECHTFLDSILERFYSCKKKSNEETTRLDAWGPLVASVSGGVAGGLAAMTAQALVVPMDVISQRQMVMDEAKYASEGSVWSVVLSAMNSSGFRALYRGFGLSLFSSLPTGSIWWSTYSGCQHALDLYWRPQNEMNDWEQAARRGTSQVVSGISAGFVAAALTQPLDVVRTRLQVEKSASLSAIVSELKETSGLRGFYRGLGPRVMHMAIWGTVLSSAYELLRHISRA